jgi:hypothetical protein
VRRESLTLQPSITWTLPQAQETIPFSMAERWYFDNLGHAGSFVSIMEFEVKL